MLGEPSVCKPQPGPQHATSARQAGRHRHGRCCCSRAGSWCSAAEAFTAQPSAIPPPPHLEIGPLEGGEVVGAACGV